MSAAVPSQPDSIQRPKRAVGRLAVAAAALGAIAVLPFGGAASASTPDVANTLQSIAPANGENLATSPTEIVLSFNQELDNDHEAVVQLSCGVSPQLLGEADYDDQGLVVRFPVQNPVPRGSCTISWRLIDEAGTTILGPESTTFRVDADPPPTTVAAPADGTSTTVAVDFITPSASTTGSAPSERPQGSSGGALWFGRLLSTLGILAVFGALALIALGWPEGPEYIVTVRYLRAMWLLTLLGTILYLIAFAAKSTGRSFGEAMSPGAWLDLADAGWPGRGALLRLVLVAGSGAMAMRPERIIDPTTTMWAWAIPGFAVVTVALSRVDGPAPWIGVLVMIAHTLAAAVWFGGAALVARVILAGPGEEDLLHATRAFSRISSKAIPVVIVTGAIDWLRLIGNPFDSGHGRVFLLKIVAVAAMVLVAVAARQQVAIRLDRAHEMTVSLADRFRRAFGAEAAIGAVVLAFSGWMLALTPAKVDRFANERYLDPLSFVDQTTGLDAKLFIGPGRVGPNGFRLEVEAPQEGITQLVLRFYPPIESGQRWIEQPLALTTAGTAVRLQSDGLPFQTAGTWTVELAVTTASGTQPALTGTFPVAGTDDVVVDDVIATTSTIAVVPVPQTSVLAQTQTTAGFASTTTSPTTSTTVANG